jgi:hypothetical protein
MSRDPRRSFASHVGRVVEILYPRLVSRLGHPKTIAAMAHRLCQLIWILLHKGVRSEERGPAVCEKSKRVRTLRMIHTLRNLGYRVEPLANLQIWDEEGNFRS